MNTAAAGGADRRAFERALRSDVRCSDVEAVRRLVEGTGFFRPEEVEVAAALVAETLEHPEESDYRFLFADSGALPGELDGYACFGHNTMTTSSWELYWIAVRPQTQGRGLGRRLLAEAEHRAAARGAVQMWVDTSGREQYGPTRAFYLGCGYRVAARLADFYAPGDDKVILVRGLAPSRAASTPEVADPRAPPRETSATDC